MPGSAAWCRTRRQLDDAGLDTVADGRVFTGRQAIELKLVDELGDEQTAIAWLAKEKNIDPKTAGARLPAARPASAICRSCIIAGDRGARRGRAWARWRARFEELGRVQAVERLNLDGLLALWHPPAAN